MEQAYIHEHGKRLYALCLKLCQNAFDANDLYQETWLKAFNAFESFDQTRSFGA